jgi:hypothetical protein
MAWPGIWTTSRRHKDLFELKLFYEITGIFRNDPFVSNQRLVPKQVSYFEIPTDFGIIRHNSEFRANLKFWTLSMKELSDICHSWCLYWNDSRTWTYISYHSKWAWTKCIGRTNSALSVWYIVKKQNPQYIVNVIKLTWNELQEWDWEKVNRRNFTREVVMTFLCGCPEKSKTAKLYLKFPSLEFLAFKKLKAYSAEKIIFAKQTDEL